MRRIQAQLERSNSDLRRKNEEVQNFYHTLSHELKTPLTSAREFVSIVMDGLAGDLNSTQREYLGISLESCNQLRICINDLLDATRLETGKLSIDLKPVLLEGSIQRVVTALRPAAEGKKIELTCEIEPGLPRISIDENRIVQVVTNLLNNALKFTESGGCIEVSAARSREQPDRLEVARDLLEDGALGVAVELPRLHAFGHRPLRIERHADVGLTKVLLVGLHFRHEVRLAGLDVQQKDPLRRAGGCQARGAGGEAGGSRSSDGPAAQDTRGRRHKARTAQGRVTGG